jgi:3-hydroxymyristoyl/3-hydroxydecanoyl-(acyl carrier protein) dehydratase
MKNRMDNSNFTEALGGSRAKRMPAFELLSEAADRIVLRLELSDDLAQFRGHFPGMPILPGVAQLDWAISVAQTFWDFPSLPNRMTQMKFRRILVPGNPVCLLLERRSMGQKVHFSFDGPSICHSSGILHWDAA